MIIFYFHENRHLSNITICYLWKARCLEVFQNVKERFAQAITKIWIEIMHNLWGFIDTIIGNTQQVELPFTQHRNIYLRQQLEFNMLRMLLNTNVVSFFGNKIAYLCNFESNFFNMVTSLYEHHATFVISLQKDIKCVIKVFFFQKCYRRH